MKEKDFQWQFTRAIKIILKNEHYVYHKISDQSMDSKPADCFLFHNFFGWLMELKYHKKHTAFAFNKVEPHQLRALDRADLSWNRWYLIIWVNLWLKKWEQFACIFEITNWLNIVKNSKNKSINLEAMKFSCDYLVYKDHKTDTWPIWNLKEFLLIWNKEYE